MNSAKGQNVLAPGELMMFIIILILGVSIYFMNVGNGNTIEQNIDTRMDFAAGEVRKRSAVDTAMVDYVWRAPDIPKSKYGNISAYNLISYYYSTDDGENLDMPSGPVSKPEVESDIGHYLGYKMNQTWQEPTSVAPVDYEITAGNDIQVSSTGYVPTGEWSRVTFRIGLVGDKKEVLVTLRTKTSQNIYSVE